MQTQKQSSVHHVNTSDGLLMQSTLTGDQDAFAALVRRYTGPLYNYILPIVHDYDQANDVVQQVFLKLYLCLPTLHKDGPLKPWLFQVAHHCCIDELRRKKRLHGTLCFSELEMLKNEEELSLLELIPDTNPLPEEVLEHHDLQRHMRQAIQTLPPKYRSIILLRYMGQLTFSEIGQVLGIPETTAKTYLHRSKPLLRKALAETESFA